MEGGYHPPSKQRINAMNYFSSHLNVLSAAYTLSIIVYNSWSNLNDKNTKEIKYSAPNIV